MCCEWQWWGKGKYRDRLFRLKDKAKKLWPFKCKQGPEKGIK